MAKAKKMWTSLKHNGPMLAPRYKRIPKTYRLKYGGERILLSYQAEEYAMLYAKHLLKIKKKNPPKLFKDNFFQDWQKVMTPQERKKIKGMSKCNFAELLKCTQEQKNASKGLSKKQKEQQRLKREANERKYKDIKVDGRHEQLNNYAVEPPGIYYGRGNNKNNGRVKPRIQMKDITINTSNPSRFPNRKKYKAVIRKPNAAWIASWIDPITGKTKYNEPSASSKIKVTSTRNKFDIARKLSEKIDVIERQYTRDLKSTNIEKRQHATATFLIHRFALRVGNENKTIGVAETVGCLSIKNENISRIGQNEVEVYFLGKDSVPYEGTWKVTTQVARNLKEFKRAGEDEIFYDISPNSLNQYLGNMMPDLTAKFFRTYRATEIFQKEVEKQFKIVSNKTDVRLKTLAIKLANLEVAKLLNHRRMDDPEKRQAAVDKLEDMIEDMKEKLKQTKKDKALNKKKRDEKIQKLTRDIDFRTSELKLKTGLVDLAPNTSKANYIDPRAIMEWCRKLKAPVETIFTKTEQRKFGWAIIGKVGDRKGQGLKRGLATSRSRSLSLPTNKRKK